MNLDQSGSLGMQMVRFIDNKEKINHLTVDQLESLCALLKLSSVGTKIELIGKITTCFDEIIRNTIQSQRSYHWSWSEKGTLVNNHIDVWGDTLINRHIEGHDLNVDQMKQILDLLGLSQNGSSWTLQNRIVQNRPKIIYLSIDQLMSFLYILSDRAEVSTYQKDELIGRILYFLPNKEVITYFSKDELKMILREMKVSMSGNCNDLVAKISQNKDKLKGLSDPILGRLASELAINIDDKNKIIERVLKSVASSMTGHLGKEPEQTNNKFGHFLSMEHDAETRLVSLVKLMNQSDDLKSFLTKLTIPKLIQLCDNFEIEWLTKDRKSELIERIKIPLDTIVNHISLIKSRPYMIECTRTKNTCGYSHPFHVFFATQSIFENRECEDQYDGSKRHTNIYCETCKSYRDMIERANLFYEVIPTKSKQKIEIKITTQNTQKVIETVIQVIPKVTEPTMEITRTTTVPVEKVEVKRRSVIPKALRDSVFTTYNQGSYDSAYCSVGCGERITPFNFECGHVISYCHGGEAKLDNLRPICSRCNRSMGAKNMDEFIKECGFIPVKIQKCHCGKPSNKGYKQCQSCYDQKPKLNNESQTQKCRCGKLSNKGYKLCQDCYKK
jgi:NADH:ubiquinone oxidoreductase subunit C